AIDGPMLNRDSLTPIYPASLSDCLIQTDPLSDARLTRVAGGAAAINPARKDVEFFCETSKKNRREAIIRVVASACFVLAIATSAPAITPAPTPQSDGMITQVRLGCGVGRTMVGGRCVARTTIRQTRRAVRRCARGVTC